jgi:hypothetical protein
VEERGRVHHVDLAIHLLQLGVCVENIGFCERGLQSGLVEKHVVAEIPEVLLEIGSVHVL